MEYILINQEEGGDEMSITLTKDELKVIHNICADIINQYPDMTNIEQIAIKIQNSFFNDGAK